MDNSVNRPASCWVRRPMNPPLRSAVFCSSQTVWLFQGEIAISPSRCTSMIAVTPIPSVHPPKKMTFCILTFFHSIGPKKTAAHSRSELTPISNWDFFWKYVLTESPALFLPDFMKFYRHSISEHNPGVSAQVGRS